MNFAKYARGTACSFLFPDSVIAQNNDTNTGERRNIVLNIESDLYGKDKK